MTGISMGGCGALLLTEKNPHFVAAVAAISPAIWKSYAQARGARARAYASAAAFAGWRVRSWSSGSPCSGVSARFRIRARPGPADTASGLAAWVALGWIARERPGGCQRLLVGRRAHLMEPGAVMTRAPVMLAADVAAIGRLEAT